MNMDLGNIRTYRTGVVQYFYNGHNAVIERNDEAIRPIGMAGGKTLIPDVWQIIFDFLNLRSLVTFARVSVRCRDYLLTNVASRFTLRYQEDERCKRQQDWAGWENLFKYPSDLMLHIDACIAVIDRYQCFQRIPVWPSDVRSVRDLDESGSLNVHHEELTRIRHAMLRRGSVTRNMTDMNLIFDGPREVNLRCDGKRIGWRHKWLIYEDVVSPVTGGRALTTFVLNVCE